MDFTLQDLVKCLTAKRAVFETYEQYKARRSQANKETKDKLKGRLIWDSAKGPFGCQHR